MALTIEQKEARLKLIEFKFKQAEKMAEIKRRTARLKTYKNKRKGYDFKESEEDIPADDYTNINAWTDSEKYAKSHYGDTYRETIRWDNEWD